MGCSPFEAHFGHKPNTIWHTDAKTASVKNLETNKKKFPSQVMQNYTLPTILK